MTTNKKRTFGRILCLCCAIILPLGIGACGQQGSGEPPSAAQKAQRLQEIKDNPHIPQSIKDAAERQAQGNQSGSGAQAAPK